MDKADRIDRLTERERECLRRWMARKTAKEIALELGVSHHAVEKRLKMARTKLGVTSSLEAARLLEEAEGYGQTVAQSAQGHAHSPLRQQWQPQFATLGAFAMILTAASVALALSQSTTPAAPDTSDPLDKRLAEMTKRTFDSLDENASGFLEGAESPFRKKVVLDPGDRIDQSGTIVRTGRLQADETPDPDRLREFYAKADRDADGRVSYAEYHSWSVPRLAGLGLTLIDGLSKPGS
ncbi:MAG: LuxR C-terminal-related transcriptional regulator [Pseudomonadota bacterium]